MMDKVAVLMLAGGASRRFGGCKLLQPVPGLGGTTMLEASLRAPLAAEVGPVIVVTGAYHAELAPLLLPLPVQVVQNPDWASGMASSMQAGLRALPPDAAGAVICLGDQPLLPPQVISDLAEARHRTGALIVAPRAGGQRRNPVLFDRSLFPELMMVTGDEGGRSLLSRHSVHYVDFAVLEWFADIDTPSDLP